MWRFSLLACVQAWSHRWHLYGFSPVWLRLCTIKLLWNLKALPQNSQHFVFKGVTEEGVAPAEGRVVVGVVWEPTGDCMEPGRGGGVARYGGLPLPAPPTLPFPPVWNGWSKRCMGLGLLGDSGGVDPEVLPASSRNRREKSIVGGGSRGRGGLRRITLSKALGWWAASASSSGLRWWGSRWFLGGGLKRGGVGGKRWWCTPARPPPGPIPPPIPILSLPPEPEPGMRRRLKGLASGGRWRPWRGGWEGQSAPPPREEGPPIRGVRGLPCSLSR